MMNSKEEGIKITRKELYDLVWSKPMTALAKEYNISDNGLRKICKKINIPLPELGHWQKIQYGKKVNKKPLPKNYKGEETITLKERKEEIGTETNMFSEYHKLLKKITADASLSFNVPDRLSNPDALIIAAKNNLDSKKNEKYAINRGVMATSSGIISVSVAPKNIGRALRIMDKIIKLLKIRGHRVIVKGDNTYAVVKGEEIKIRFRERLKKIIIKQENRSWDYTEYTASGILSFKIDMYPEKEFNDTEKQMLEEQLPKILAKLELVSENLKRRREEREKWQSEYQKKLEQEEAVKKSYADEIKKLNKLLDDSERWRKAVNVRNYIKEVENKAIRENNLTEELSNWIKWANDKIDVFDPLTGNYGYLLDIKKSDLA